MAVRGNYVDGFMLAVPSDKQAEYLETAELFARVMKKYGLLDYVECWQDDVPEGTLNSFHTAVLREEGESIVFSFATWPDKATRDEAWGNMESDSELADMTPENMAWDGKRMIWGGFKPILNV